MINVSDEQLIKLDNFINLGLESSKIDDMDSCLIYIKNAGIILASLETNPIDYGLDAIGV